MMLARQMQLAAEELARTHGEVQRLEGQLIRAEQRVRELEALQVIHARDGVVLQRETIDDILTVLGDVAHALRSAMADNEAVDVTRPRPTVPTTYVVTEEDIVLDEPVWSPEPRALVRVEHTPLPRDIQDRLDAGSLPIVPGPMEPSGLEIDVPVEPETPADDGFRKCAMRDCYARQDKGSPFCYWHAANQPPMPEVEIIEEGPELLVELDQGLESILTHGVLPTLSGRRPTKRGRKR